MAFYPLHGTCPTLIRHFKSAVFALAVILPATAHASPFEALSNGDLFQSEATLGSAFDLQRLNEPDRQSNAVDYTTAEQRPMSCPSGEGGTCEDQVRLGHIGADGPLWSPLGLPLFFHNQSVRECAVKHDLCYFKQIPGAGPSCDQELLDCLNQSGNLPFQLVGLPYNVILNLIFGSGLPQYCAYQNVQRNCRCNFSPPQSEIERIAENIWTTESLTIKHSECCDASGNCKPTGTECTVELKTRRPGSFLTSIDVFKGTCLQDSASPDI